MIAANKSAQAPMDITTERVRQIFEGLKKIMGCSPRQYSRSQSSISVACSAGEAARASDHFADNKRVSGDPSGGI